MKEEIKHNWVALCSDINTPNQLVRNWWRCANCKKETERTMEEDMSRPDDRGCKAKTKGSIFPLSSI